jgi:predicted nucleic acid-binding protein
LIYLDTSALVTLLTGRPPAADLEAFLAARPILPMATSTVGFVETVRTMDRIGDYPSLMQDLDRRITEILITEDVRDAAASLPVGVRTLDAIHLASAQVIGDSLAVLLTYDRRMLEVARSIGLPAEAPGLAP